VREAQAGEYLLTVGRGEQLRAESDTEGARAVDRRPAVLDLADPNIVLT
jgi:hypothetical protein